MALKFLDGFDAYATADITKKWTTVSASGVTINSTAGRRGGGALRFANWGTPTLSKTLDSNIVTIIVGFAIKMTAFPAIEGHLFLLMDSGTVVASLSVTSAGILRVYNNTMFGTLLGSGSSSLTLSTYHYIELKIKIDNSTGTVDLYKNGSNILSLTGQDTQNGSNSYVNVLQLGSTSGSGTSTIDFDDLYVSDTTGSYNTSLLGDVRIETLFPTSDGSNTAWTCSTGSTHYTLVDETTPNTSDYVSTSTVGNKDTYGFGDIGGTVSAIYGVQVNMAALKDDAGSRSIAATVKSSSTNADGSSLALSTGQLIYTSIFETDPNTSAAWTQANVNAAEFGVKCAV